MSHFRTRLPNVANAAFVAVSLGVLVLYATLFFVLAPGTGSADGHYNYLFARSLAFDGDVDFRNDYASCGDPWGAGRDRGTGRPDNQGYVGPSAFWVPVLAVARMLGAGDGCRGGAVSVALFCSVVAGALTVGLAFLAAKKVAGERAAVIAALAFAVASSLPHYAVLHPAYTHVYEALACALVLWLSLTASERQALRPWAWVGLACGLGALQRLSNTLLLLIPLGLLLTSREPARHKLASSALVLAGTALGVGLTLALYRYLYGSVFVLPQGRHYLQLWHAHPLLLLFAPHGGLLYATPVAWLGLLGLGLGLASPGTRRLSAWLAAAFLACLWIASSALDWHAKGTFGARRLVVMTPVLIVGAAMTLARVAPFLRRHAVAVATLAILTLLALPVLGGMLAVRRGELPVERSSPQAVQYGSGARALFASLDERGFDVAILPAELVYWTRYRLPPRTFRAATTDRFYRRSYHTLEWEPRALPFTDPVALEASSGLERAADGARIRESDARMVFAAGWPHATLAELSVLAEASADVELSLGTFFRRCTLGTRRAERGDVRVLSFDVPSGCFDSGLMEVRVKSSVPGRIVLRQLALNDTAVYPPSY